MKVKVLVAQSRPTVRPHGLYPTSMELSRQEYWSGLPFPSPGNLPNPGIEPRSPHDAWLMNMVKISLSLLIGEMQRKTPVKNQLIFTRFTKINKPDSNQVWNRCREIEAFTTADKNVN